MTISYEAWCSLCRAARETWFAHSRHGLNSTYTLQARNRWKVWTKMAQYAYTPEKSHPVTDLYTYVFTDIAREGMTPGEVWDYEGPPTIEELCEYLSCCYNDGSIGDYRPRMGDDPELDLMMRVSQILINE